MRIENLTVEVDNKQILKNFNLNIKQGEIHALMGPNGVGKSTLSKAIMGSKNITILEGDIYYNDEKLNELTTDERAKKGIFLAMQNPTSIDGVTNADFMRTAVSFTQGKRIGLYEFIKESDNAMEDLDMDKEYFHREVNVGFSGGEKKRNEILQMKLLKPSFIILDEIDSGLDIDSIKIVTDNINKYIKETGASVLIITHYLKLLEYIKPDKVHVIHKGRIVKEGTYKLAEEIEKNGYDSLKEVPLGACLIKEPLENE